MRVAPILLLAILLSGCTAQPPPSPPPSPSPQPFSLLSIDGRWTFDSQPARDLVAAAWPNASGGAILRGEARVAHGSSALAVHVLAIDPEAAAIVGDPAARADPGTVVLSDGAAAQLHVRAGDRVTLRADAWPESRTTRYHEMELVRSCASAATDPCALEPAANGDVRLRFRVPPRTVALAFQPDARELGPRDYPAYWNGSFAAPDGTTTPFTTYALSASELGEPGRLDPGGELAAGDWTISFGLEANGTRLTRPDSNAVSPPGGILTTRGPGFDEYDYALYDINDLAAQTRALLANATAHEASLAIARIVPREGALALLDADALVAPADAAALLGARAGEATALVVRAGHDADALARAVANATDPRVAQLHLRGAAIRPHPDPSGGALVLAAPAGIDITRLPAVDGLDRPILTLELGRALGANDSALDAPDAAFRILALPYAGSLASGGAWPTEGAALDAIARSPNLALVSSDLAALAHGNVTYAPLVLDEALGPQRYNVMGAIDDGPRSTVWVAASLLAGAGAPEGARVVVPLHGGADPAGALARATEAWAAYGVAPMVSTGAAHGSFGSAD